MYLQLSVIHREKGVIQDSMKKKKREKDLELRAFPKKGLCLDKVAGEM